MTVNASVEIYKLLAMLLNNPFSRQRPIVRTERKEIHYNAHRINALQPFSRRNQSIMLKVAQKISGSLSAQYLPMLDRAISSFKGTRYTFADVKCVIKNKRINMINKRILKIIWL